MRVSLVSAILFYPKSLASYVSALAVSANVLRSQADAYFQQFIRTITTNFLISIRLIGNTTEAITTDLPSPTLVSISTAYGGTCICEYDSSCIGDSWIFERFDVSSLKWLVPGIYRGCCFSEALRQSDLHCLYDEECLNDLQLKLQVNQTLDITPIDSSSLRHFDLMTPMGVVIDPLMVDHWNWTIAHTDYYGQGRSEECTYTMESHNSLLMIVTTMIGLTGGLMTALKLIIPIVVKLLLKCIQKRRDIRITPVGNENEYVANRSMDIQVEEVNH